MILPFTSICLFSAPNHAEPSKLQKDNQDDQGYGRLKHKEIMNRLCPLSVHCSAIFQTWTD